MRQLERGFCAFDIRRGEIDVAFRDLLESLIAGKSGRGLLLGGDRQIAGLHRSRLLEPQGLLAFGVDVFFRKVGAIIDDGLSGCRNGLLHGGLLAQLGFQRCRSDDDLLAIVRIIHTRQHCTGFCGRAFIEGQKHDSGLNGLEAQYALMGLDVSGNQERIGWRARAEPAAQRAATQNEQKKENTQCQQIARYPCTQQNETAFEKRRAARDRTIDWRCHLPPFA